MDGPGGAGTQELEVRLLGPIEVERGGERVALGGQKPRALLALLALEPGRVVSVDRIVEALWPGDPPETAAHAVQVYVSQLRKALGPAIATRAPGYVLEIAQERVDAHRFSRLAQEGRVALSGSDAASAEVALREALTLWRGPALADFVYEPFAQTHIARLEELRTVVVEERIEADLELGRHAELVAELEALVRAEPLRERPRAQLMLALYRSGRQADALAVYRDARDTLVDQLGIEPGPELRELEAAVLRQDDSLLLDETLPTSPPMQFRRLATIVFVDVVDSMAVAEQLDAEALGTVQRRYFETVSTAIQRHGGAVEKYAGDAVMAVFGVPVTHEDDALRAARAAIDARLGVAALSEQLTRDLGIGLEVRIGLAAGEVVAAATDSRQRFVAGDAIGVAARLQHAAEPGEIVVGEVVARLIGQAATFEALGTLEVSGRKTPLEMFRLVRLAPASPAFEARQAALVGRKRELAAIRRALKRAVDGSAAQVAVVIGQAGVGKSRLISELARRTKNVRVLRGRCLSYGDGITYWPLREVVDQAPAGRQRDAALAALDAEPPLPAAEIALRFRQLCEALAREQPLVLVLDDLHWAEPTFLELVEHLADKGRGPILVVCVAREELFEEHADFLDGRPNAARIVLDPLSKTEMDALLEGLGGAVLGPDERARIVAAADGNPFFLEQLLALELEGGLAERALPETVQALLAARLDRLGPGERAVLERAAVIGKEFTAGDVLALLDAAAAPTAESHLQVLSDRGFVRPRRAGAFGFRHVLLQEAVYRSAPKRLRAELHERYADRLDSESPDLPELDEFVGYHLEQAYGLRTELGESDRRTERLAEDGGRRIGEAGIRASKRGDAPAEIALLRRAIAMLREGEHRRALATELAMALNGRGEPDSAVELYERVIGAAVTSRDRHSELRARVELEYTQLPRTPGATAESLLAATAQAIPALEAAGDDRGLGRTLLLAGWIQGQRYCRHGPRAEAAERALVHYRRAAWPTSTPAGELASALYYGPTSVADAIERCTELLETEQSNRYGRANIEVFLGGLLAQQGDFETARRLVCDARATYEELGHTTAVATFSGVIAGDIELLAGDLVCAEETFRWVCEVMTRAQAYSHLASRGGDLAEALYRQGRLLEAAEWVGIAEAHTAADDLDALTLWMPVRAKLVAQNGELEKAVVLASEASSLVAPTDALNRRAAVSLDVGQVLLLANRTSEAVAAFESSRELFEEKGNLAGVSRARSFLNDMVHA